MILQESLYFHKASIDYPENQSQLHEFNMSAYLAKKTFSQTEKWACRTYFHSQDQAYCSKSSQHFFLLGSSFSKCVTIFAKDHKIGTTVQTLNMRFLPVRLRLEKSNGETEEIDIRPLFGLYSRVLKFNSLN